mgnify:CR=1 FL=1
MTRQRRMERFAVGNIITTAFSLVAAYAVMHYRNHVSSMRLLGRM